MRWFIDTEFNDRPKDQVIDLISIGMVREDGKPFYAVSSEFNARLCGPWLRRNVLPHLKGVPVPDTRANIRDAIKAVIREDCEPPEFWGWFADYDWVIFCQLFGGMLSLPKGWPNVCWDLRQELARYGYRKSDLPAVDPAQVHDALYDAVWTRDSFLWLQKQRDGGLWVVR